MFFGLDAKHDSRSDIFSYRTEKLRSHIVSLADYSCHSINPKKKTDLQSRHMNNTQTD